MDTTMLDDIESRLRNIIDAHFPDSLAHGRFHVLRVVALCKQIATALHEQQDEHQGSSIDMQVLLAAAYLHDIGRLDEIGALSSIVPPASEPHASRSVVFARAILASMPGFPASKIPAVEHAILAHSFSKGEQPGTIEARILSDADKIDAIGAQGIIRTVAYSVENRRTIDDTVAHFNEKILKLKDLLLTIPAREIAGTKHDIVASFVDDLVHDLAGVPPRACKKSSK